MQQLTNKSGIPLSLALWLADDDYDHSDDPNTISATSLLKPIRAITLARQNKDLIKIGDIEALIPSRMGTALHTAIEMTWTKETKKIKAILKSLGYGSHVIDNIIVNPKPEDITTTSICVYLEIRGTKKVGKYTITGKFDIVMDGQLEDFKSTGTYNWIAGSNKLKYMQQGSIYKWLFPVIITNGIMKIQYIFTDWSKIKSLREKDYPNKRLKEQQLELMSEQATQTFIERVLGEVERHENHPQNLLPKCTADELWQKPDVFKYYKDPTKKARSTKNFTSMRDAITRQVEDGSVGQIDTHKGEVIRCRYCDVIGICDQAKQYMTEGILFP